MLPSDRKYHYSAELTIHQSRVFKGEQKPKDDELNWLFIDLDGHLYGFVYRIMNPDEASYNKPFNVEISIFAIEAVMDKINLLREYNVLRGMENIGTIKAIKELSW